MPDTINNVKLRSEEVQEILEATPNWMIRWGNMLILLLILMLLFISWFVKYPDTINSSAIITTKLPPQKEYAKISAKIASILVSDNQLVKADTPLAIIENTANFKHVFLLKSIIDTITINNTTFNFPFDELPILFLGNIEAEYALFENSYIKYQLNRQYKPFSNEANANRSTKNELQVRLEILKSQKKNNQLELNNQEIIFERNKTLFERGVISKQDFEQAEILYSQAKRNFANMDVSISNITEAINNIDKNSRITTIDKTREDISLLKNVIQSFNQLKQATKTWELQYVLKSNINGKVSFLNTWTENQMVNSQDLIFTIIPEKNSAFIAYLKSPAQNSGKLKAGQRVNIKLQNYPDKEFGTLQGQIEQIALFPNKDGQYLITVSLPKTLITSYKKEISFRHEMNGSAEIITDDLRLIERFFYKIKNIFKS